MPKQWIWILAVLLFSSIQGYACKPCARTFDLQQTFQNADLVLMVSKVADGPKYGNPGPAWIKLKIKDVLKGEHRADTIQVHSWFGMCPYGIIIDDQDDYVIFLKHMENGQDIQYSAVNNGCALTKYKVTDNKVQVAELNKSLEDFKHELQSFPSEK